MFPTPFLPLCILPFAYYKWRHNHGPVHGQLLHMAGIYCHVIKTMTSTGVTTIFYTANFPLFWVNSIFSLEMLSSLFLRSALLSWFSFYPGRLFYSTSITVFFSVLHHFKWKCKETLLASIYTFPEWAQGSWVPFRVSRSPVPIFLLGYVSCTKHWKLKIYGGGWGKRASTVKDNPR